MKYRVYITILLLIFVFPPIVDAEIYYVTKEGNDENSGSAWDDSFLTITRAMEEVGSGDSVWVAEGTYTEEDTITAPEDVALYGGFSGEENKLSERNVDMYNTIIHGLGRHRCFNNSGVISGFSITKGYTEEDGGGIWSESKSALIEDCKIYNNISDQRSAPQKLDNRLRWRYKPYQCFEKEQES